MDVGCMQASARFTFVRSEIADSGRCRHITHSYAPKEGRAGNGGAAVALASEERASEGAVCVVIVLPSDAAAAIDQNIGKGYSERERA